MTATVLIAWYVTLIWHLGSDPDVHQRKTTCQKQNQQNVYVMYNINRRGYRWIMYFVKIHKNTGKKCITQWRITLPIYNTNLKHILIVLYVAEGSFIPLVFIHTKMSHIYDRFWLYIHYNLLSLPIPQVHFPMKLRSWYATIWYIPLEDTPLCNTLRFFLVVC